MQTPDSTMLGEANLPDTIDIRKEFVGLTPGQVQQTINRFWSRVNVGNRSDCWEWAAGCGSDGYGNFSLNGRSRRTHRLSYLFTRGHWPLPCCLHSCDNPPCCNPRHLREGTHEDNVIDRDRKGRQARGEGNGRAKLKEPEVTQIRAIFADGRWTKTELAAYFGISIRQVGNIVEHRSWAGQGTAAIHQTGAVSGHSGRRLTVEDQFPTCVARADAVDQQAHCPGGTASGRREQRAA